MLVESPRVHREVVSFVRRSTRMNDSQRKAWQTHRGRFVVEVPAKLVGTSISPDARVDWVEEFGRSAPMIVEIGSGIGDSLVPMAAARPEVNFVAFEVFSPAVAQTISRLVREQVDNVRLVVADGVQGLTRLVPDSSLAEVWTFFADPWHKKRHHKRRLVNAEFGQLVADKLAPDGLWRLATDWADYAKWMREELDDHPGLDNIHSGWAPRLDARPLTKFERRGIEQGRKIFDLTYRRSR